MFQVGNRVMSRDRAVPSKLPVIVIGASGSIGTSILERLLVEGFSVHGTVRSDSTATSLRERFSQDSVSVSCLDVVDLSHVRETVNQVAAEAGGIFGVVYAAGLQIRTPLQEFSVEQMADVIAVNLTGAVVASQTALAHMVQRKHGRFVFVGSLTTKFSISGIAPYAMAKSALSSWARSIAVEYACHGITANAVLPGRIESTMIADVMSDERRESTLSRIPAGRMGQPGDVSNAVVFLLSEHASYVNGAELVVDGAWLAGGGNIRG